MKPLNKSKPIYTPVAKSLPNSPFCPSSAPLHQHGSQLPPSAQDRDPDNLRETMDAQQKLFLMNAKPQRSPPSHNDPSPAPVWLQRMSLIVLVLFCFYIGGLLAILPWSPRYWDQNAWLLSHPTLETILGKGWVRGLASGIGLLDIWIGISELLNYKDFRG